MVTIVPWRKLPNAAPATPEVPKVISPPKISPVANPVMAPLVAPTIAPFRIDFDTQNMGNMGTDGTFPRFSSTRKQGAPAWEPPSQLLAVHLSGATIDAGLRPRGIV